jgi:hypothetical protein
MSKNKDGWIAHAMGMQKLIELRGPESFQTLPERAAFQTFRPSIIFASLILRQPTILSQQRWKDVPWALDPEQKILIHHLVDILADCPGLVAQKDRALAANEVLKPQLIRQLKEQFSLRLKQLAYWKNCWDVTETQYCHEVPAAEGTPTVNNTTEDMPRKAWETVWSYNTLYHANALTIYHATHIHYLKLTLSLDGEAFAEEKLDSAQDEYSAGIEICRSVDYHLDKMREGAGSFFLMFPLRMAWEAVGKVEPAIGTWLQDVLKKIETGVAGRWALAGYLLEIDTSPKVTDGRVDYLDG